jgi:YegS/Rv2252/BmrU family lipid kinase
MRLCLVVNPNAGRKKGHAVAQRVGGLLSAAGNLVEEMVSVAPGGIREIGETIDPSDWDAVVAVGGDGTLFELVNGLLASSSSIPIPLGQIPVGTGNSFLKDLGIHTVEDAVSAITSGRTRRVDVGHCAHPDGAFHFVNLLGAGFVSNVAERARRYKRLGSASYVLGVLQEVIRLRASAIRLTIDGEVLEREGIFVEICNSRFTGGNMMMAPEAKIDDALFDVVVAGRMNRRTLLRLLPAIFSGRHVDSPAVEVFRGRHVSLEVDRPMALTPDGELLGTTPVDVSLSAGALEMFGS